MLRGDTANLLCIEPARTNGAPFARGDATARAGKLPLLVLTDDALLLVLVCDGGVGNCAGKAGDETRGGGCGSSIDAGTPGDATRGGDETRGGDTEPVPLLLASGRGERRDGLGGVVLIADESTTTRAPDGTAMPG